MGDLVAFLRARLDEEVARVLVEVDSKRRIVQVCAEAIESGRIKPDTTWNDDAKGAVVGQWILELMALPFADHPGYDSAWAPKE